MTPSLGTTAIEAFISEGFVRLERAFPRALADEVCALLWKKSGCDPEQPATWTQPVVRVGELVERPVVDAANTAELHAAFDALVGPGRWLPRMSLGSFPLRFPSDEDPGDTGWHVDASFPGADPHDYFSYRANVASRGRALLMLFLFSDVGEDDAPTRLRAGSHRDVARLLAEEGEQGLAFMQLAERAVPATEHRPTALATGEAGTVYLCHPLVVHAAQPHRGRLPRFMAQPPLFPREPLRIDGPSPVERAIREALEGS